MKVYVFISALIVSLFQLSQASPLRLHKRAAFYIANETACVVDNLVYSNGDPIPTDDPCEACKCRPPGFACVLKDCPKKPGCRAVRRVGECCPDYVCGCEHNGRMYRDGDEIRDSKNPCYTCHCQGSSIACAFVDCFFRVDCAPEYAQDKCCPEYNHCNVSADAALGENSELVTETPITADTKEVVYSDVTNTPPLTESKVEYVESEDNTSSDSSEDIPAEVETRSHAVPPQILTADVSESVHKFALNVHDVETTKTQQTTTSGTPIENETTSELNIELISEKDSSPVVEVSGEPEKQEENETKLLKTDLDISDSLNSEEEGASPSEDTLTSTVIVPEANSELFATTETQLQEDASQTSEVSELKVVTNVPDVTENPLLAIEEFEKETNEIKKFRSLNNNITEEDSQTESTDVNNDSVKKEINDESKIPEDKEETESIENETISLTKENLEKAEEQIIKAAEISATSEIPEDKIAEYLILLKKASSSNDPTLVEPMSHPISTIPSSDATIPETTSETNVVSEAVASDVVAQTTTEDKTTTGTSSDVEQNLSRAFSELLDSNENQEILAIQTQTSTSQKDDGGDLSTHKQTEAISIPTLTTEQEQNAVTENQNTEPATEKYTVTENPNSDTTSEDKQSTVSAKNAEESR